MNLLGIDPQVWFPVVTLVIGFVGKGMLDARADSRIAMRERSARHESRVSAAALRRIEFQRATLLATQEAVLQATRSATTVHFHDLKNMAAIGGWGSVLLDDASSSRQREDMAILSTHRVRIRDDVCRKQLDALASAITTVGMARSHADSEAALHSAANASIELNERIGDLLRTLDDQEDKAMAG